MVKQEDLVFFSFQIITEYLKLEGTPLSPSNSMLLLKWSHQGQVTPDCVQPGFQYIHGWEPECL